MKITDEHYNQLKAMIAPLKDKLPAHREYIIAEGKAKDVDKRLRWDALYSAKGGNQFICDNLYKYLNDDHIDTALKAIMKELNR